MYSLWIKNGIRALQRVKNFKLGLELMCTMGLGVYYYECASERLLFVSFIFVGLIVVLDICSWIVARFLCMYNKRIVTYHIYIISKCISPFISVIFHLKIFYFFNLQNLEKRCFKFSWMPSKIILYIFRFVKFLRVY